ncbi:hypothetical protein BASA62_005254 [Batrachochytrium salamandrivorans]|nr:hypothetical protein BASA62_005254 [Batrachochytrium salamandrivorans]
MILGAFVDFISRPQTNLSQTRPAFLVTFGGCRASARSIVCISMETICLSGNTQQANMPSSVTLSRNPSIPQAQRFGRIRCGCSKIEKQENDFLPAYSDPHSLGIRHTS